MDRQIKTNKWTFKRLSLLGGGFLLASLLVSLVVNTNGSTFVTDADRVSLGSVTFGPFQDIVPVTGTIEPIRILYLDAIEGGRVEEVFVEEGAMVVEGQPLLRLTNTTLMLDFMNRETQIIEQVNNLRNTRITMELNERDINAQLLDIDYDLGRIKRQFVVDTALFKAEAIASLDYENSKENFHYLQSKKNMLVASNRNDSLYRRQQMVRIDHSIELMERNLEAIRKNLENLTVKAPISGQLTSFDAEIGETKTRGENLGRIDMLDGYRVRSFVDEHYISRVKTGQKGAFTLSGNQLELSITKVLPEVSNGQFEVELEFADTVPTNIHRGQSLQIKLAMSHQTEATLLPRGGFYNSTGGNWVFVVNDDGEAVKRNVKLGRQNPTHIEVIEGLQAGDRVIVSSYNGFEDVDKVILKQ